MSNEDDDEFMGAGTDLAFSFGGVFLLTTIILVVKIWFVSVDAQTLLANVNRELEKEKSLRVKYEKLISTQQQDWVSKEADREMQAQSTKQSIDECRRTLEARGAEIKLLKGNLVRFEETNGLRGSEITELRDRVLRKTGEVEELKRTLELREREINQLKGNLGKIEHTATETQDALTKSEEKNIRIARSATELERTIEQQKIALRAANDKPPLLMINDDKGISIFPAGSAEPTSVLLDWLISIAPSLEESAAKYNTKVIEVVGHTDEVNVGQSMQEKKNLDKSLLKFLWGQEQARVLGACDNVGLGMARAAAVVAELTRLGLATKFILLPLSAGQAIDLDGRLASGHNTVVNEPRRRRIEIRLRRTN